MHDHSTTFRSRSFLGVVLGALALVWTAACASGLEAEMDGQETVAPDGAVAIFAGGCFWCMEPPFEKLDGVIEVESGYTGGEIADPGYDAVSSGRTKHTEAVRVRYDPSRIDYRTLLEVFWRQIDPTDAGGQFADRGSQYRTAIFVSDDEQRRLAGISRTALDESGRFDAPIITEIVEAGPFWPAEAYHQDYYKKNPAHYARYRIGSGREGFLVRVWGETADAP